MPHRIAIAGLFLFAAGCTRPTEVGWPNLADPLPERADRIVTYTPIPLPPAAPGSTPVDAAAVLADGETKVAAAKTRYRQAVEAFLRESDESERAILWRSAQLALTHISMALNGVEAGLFDLPPAERPALIALRRTTLDFVNAEADRLTALRP